MLDQMSTEALIDVSNLTISLHSTGFAVVNGVSFSLKSGEFHGIVGESGSGKSLSVRAVAGLISDRVFDIKADRFELFGTDLLNANKRDAATARLSAAMIFQDPAAALNPLMRVGDQVAEAAMLGLGISRPEALEQAREALTQVALPDVDVRMRQFPDALSGGQKQRVMIAAALVARPKVIIADEPTTALDVTTQLQVLSLLKGLARESGIATLLITHDLGLVSQTCDRTTVLYAGEDVESGPTRDLIENPDHPYTQALLDSHPASTTGTLNPIPGVISPSASMSERCRFLQRCSAAGASCQAAIPGVSQSEHRRSRCHYSTLEGGA